MKILIRNRIFLFVIVIGFSLSFISPDYLEWSKERTLSFTDFKATPPQNTGSDKTVNLTTIISYKTEQVPGKIPKVTIMNLVDRNASWIRSKKPEILHLQQIKFDYSELYARKIRKEMLELNKKGVKDKQKYIDAITKWVRASEKRQRANNILLEDQPHLIKIMQKDIQDSLNSYKVYTK